MMQGENIRLLGTPPEISEYCEVKQDIDKTTAATAVALVTE